MAKKIVGLLKLRIPAGGATPAPPVGPALGQKGLNIQDFCKAFNAMTEKMEKGIPLPVQVTCYDDRTFTFAVKQPNASALIKKHLSITKGSAQPHKVKVAKLSRQVAEDIVKEKMPDLNANDMDAAVKIIAGTARSMGIDYTG